MKTTYTTQSNTEFARTISDSSVQLLDVRTPDEYASGHIPGAVNLDVQDAAFDRRAASFDKARPTAVYCRSGVRSKAAAAKLTAQGLQVYELEGGIMNWNGKTIK